VQGAPPTPIAQPLVDHGTSPISLNAAITGLKFFFGITLDRGELMAKMQSVFVPRTLPVVLSREEVVRLIGAAGNLKHQTALSVAYGAGIRAAEVAALNVGDVDSSRMSLRIEQGKGAKDRYAMLAPVLLIRPLTSISLFSVSSTLERTTSSTCPLSFSSSTGSGPSAVSIVISRLAKRSTRQNDQAKCFAPCCQLALPARYGAFLPPRTRSLSPVIPWSFDIDCHMHPRMNTALKKMFALRQTRDLQVAALKDTSPGHRDVLKASSTFGNHRLASIEGHYETAPEFRHLGKGMGLTTLVDYDKGGSFLDRDPVGLEVPGRVWSSSRCLFK